MDKFAAIKTTSSKIDRLIIEHLSKCASLKEAIDDLISSPTEDTAGFLQQQFDDAQNHLTLINNAITTLASQIVSEDGEIEYVDGEADEDGVRLQ